MENDPAIGTRRATGIGEMIVSDDVDDVLVTYALGSCVGLALYDPHLRLGAIIHCMMPLSTQSPERALETPLMYTDTGVASLLQEMFMRGSTSGHIVAKVAGAASSTDDGGLFRVGERNYAVLRRVLWKNDILIAGEDVGGHCARTLTLEIRTGRTITRSAGLEKEI